MASASEIRYEFTASVADLEQKAAIAQTIIEEKVAKQIDSIGTKSTVSDRKIVGMMKNIAREGRAVSPMLGKIGVAIAGIDAVVVPLYRSFETFFAKMQPGLERMGMAILSGITNPAGIAITAVVALGTAAYVLWNVFGEANQKSRAYVAALNAMQKAHEEMLEAVRAGTLKAALADDKKGWIQTHIDALKKEYEKGADDLQKLTNENEFVIKKILEGKGNFPAPPPSSAPQWDPWTGEAPKRNTADEDIAEKRDKMVASLRQTVSVMQLYQEQLANVEALEKSSTEAQKEGAEEAERAVTDALAAADAEYKALQANADKAIEAVEREDAAAQAHADREAERAAEAEQQIQDRMNLEKLAADQVMNSKFAFYEWAASLEANMADVYQGIQSIANMAVSGIGDSFARAMVYGESFGEAMDALWKQMAASLISMLIQVALQSLIYLALTALGIAAAGSVKLGVEVAYGAVAAAASAYAAVPFPLNVAAAAAAGAAATIKLMAIGAAGMVAGAGLGASSLVGGAFAEGGLVTGSMLAVVGEGGEHELIAPRSDYERLFENQNNSSNWAIYLDGRELTHSVVRHVPGIVRQRGVKGL